MQHDRATEQNLFLTAVELCVVSASQFAPLRQRSVVAVVCYSCIGVYVARLLRFRVATADWNATFQHIQDGIVNINLLGIGTCVLCTCEQSCIGVLNLNYRCFYQVSAVCFFMN